MVERDAVPGRGENIFGLLCAPARGGVDDPGPFQVGRRLFDGAPLTIAEKTRWTLRLISGLLKSPITTVGS
jgi:hypothetical protein